MFALILLIDLVAAFTVTMDATVTTKASFKHKIAPSSTSTNQLNDCLFHLGSVMKMCRKKLII